MPEQVRQPGDIRPGDVFEDCRFHPCYCYDIGDDGSHVFGISLIDGSTWQCHIAGCAVRKLTPAEAWRWKSEGPPAEDLPPEERWRQQRHAEPGAADVTMNVKPCPRDDGTVGTVLRPPPARTPDGLTGP